MADQDTPMAVEHDADDPKIPVEVTVDDSGPARKTLKIVIPAERIAEKIESSFSQLRQDANLPGFRKGRAPRRLIERRFGSNVRDDAKAQLLSEAYTEAIEAQSLDVLGEPEIKDIESIELPDSGPLNFEVDIEVLPPFELPSLEGIEVTKPRLEVSDEDVEQELERLKQRFAKPVEGGASEAAEGDFVTAAVAIYTGHDAAEDAEAISENPTIYIRVNGEAAGFRGHVMGIVIDDLGKTLAGMKVGETARVNATGPAQHELEAIREQAITVQIRVDHIERMKPAALDEVVTTLGFESEPELRDRLKQELEGRLDRELQMQMHQQIVEHLMGSVEFELPEKLTGRQTSRLLRRRAMEMVYYEGLNDDQVEERLNELRGGTEAEARTQLKQYFVIDRAAKLLEIEIGDREVNARIAALAQSRGRRPEKMRQELIESGEIEGILLSIREEKTLNAILEKAVVKEVDPPAEGEASPADPAASADGKASTEA